jgi:cytochrome c peroxidase
MKSIQQFTGISILIIVGFLFLKCTRVSVSESYLGKMIIPIDNQQTKAKIEFGKQLFFDTQLSPDNTVSCATCHQPNRAFTDGQKLSVGFHNRLAMRNAPTLLNVGYQKALMFDGQVPNLEMQVLVPLQDSAEMANDMKTLIFKLRKNPKYQEQAKKLYNRDFDPYVLTRSLAAFQRSLLSFQTSFDKYQSGNPTAISESAKRGWKVYSRKLYCTECHTPPHFTNFKVENNGLYSDYSDILDKGRYRINNDSTEIGAFKVPTLRNIMITSPYMHDGSLNNILEVIAHYKKGGNQHFNQSKVIREFNLTKKEEKDLLEFFKTLSD